MTRGERNNNPGNIRANNTFIWQGQTGVDPDGFCIFDTIQNGLRAIGKLLCTYQTHHGLTTIRGLINRWAPPTENDTGAYVTDVAADCGVSPDALFSLHDQASLALIIAAIVKHENGEQPYDAGTIGAAAYAALAQWD